MTGIYSRPDLYVLLVVSVALRRSECRYPGRKMSSPLPPAAALADREVPETAPCSYLGPLIEKGNDGHAISRQPACLHPWQVHYRQPKLIPSLTKKQAPEEVHHRFVLAGPG